MSYTFILSGTSSELRLIVNPPIILEDDAQYVMGLVNFETFYSIPNIEPPNNKFYLGKNYLEIPEGTYEIRDIDAIVGKWASKTLRSTVRIDGNNNTLKTEIRATDVVDFRPDDCIRDLLGFKPKTLAPNQVHMSDSPARIFKVNAILIDCNVISGSYSNNQEVHIIHQMFPDVEPGYKFIDNPVNVIYLPVTTKTIDTITLKILDQDGKRVNFRGETVTIRLHLKRLPKDAP